MKRVRNVKFSASHGSLVLIRRWSSSRHRLNAEATTTLEDSQDIPSLQVAENTSHEIRQHEDPILTIGDLIPLHSFSTSIYSIPTLLLLRLFYHATPFDLGRSVSRCRQVLDQPKPKLIKVTTPANQSLNRDDTVSTFLDTSSCLQVKDFLTTLQTHPNLASDQLIITSLTWIKALASPLSHEYIQFLVLDRRTHKTRRLVVERTEHGDTVTVGWDWSSGQYASHHHVLPLPLLTLHYHDHDHAHAPSLLSFAHIFVSVSGKRPYRLVREMCWWYAEQIFMETARRFSTGAVVEEWPYASLRYSFVVRTEWIRRPVLVREAEEFRRLNIEGMRY